MVPQQRLADTTAVGVRPDDRRRLDLVIYGATQRGEALCCDATFVSPLGRDGRPTRGAADRDGAAPEAAAQRKHARCPELSLGGPQRLCVLARRALERRVPTSAQAAHPTARAPSTGRPSSGCWPRLGAPVVECVVCCRAACPVQRRARRVPPSQGRLTHSPWRWCSTSLSTRRPVGSLCCESAGLTLNSYSNIQYIHERKSVLRYVRVSRPTRAFKWLRKLNFQTTEGFPAPL